MHEWRHARENFPLDREGGKIQLGPHRVSPVLSLSLSHPQSSSIPSALPPPPWTLAPVRQSLVVAYSLLIDFANHAGS